MFDSLVKILQTAFDPYGFDPYGEEPLVRDVDKWVGVDAIKFLLFFAQKTALLQEFSVTNSSSEHSTQGKQTRYLYGLASELDQFYAAFIKKVSQLDETGETNDFYAAVKTILVDMTDTEETKRCVRLRAEKYYPTDTQYIEACVTDALEKYAAIRTTFEALIEKRENKTVILDVIHRHLQQVDMDLVLYKSRIDALNFFNGKLNNVVDNAVIQNVLDDTSTATPPPLIENGLDLMPLLPPPDSVAFLKKLARNGLYRQLLTRDDALYLFLEKNEVQIFEANNNDGADKTEPFCLFMEQLAQFISKDEDSLIRTMNEIIHFLPGLFKFLKAQKQADPQSDAATQAEIIKSSILQSVILNPNTPFARGAFDQTLILFDESHPLTSDKDSSTYLASSYGYQALNMRTELPGELKRKYESAIFDAAETGNTSFLALMLIQVRNRYKKAVKAQRTALLVHLLDEMEAALSHLLHRALLNYLTKNPKTSLDSDEFKECVADLVSAAVFNMRAVYMVRLRQVCAWLDIKKIDAELDSQGLLSKTKYKPSTLIKNLKKVGTAHMLRSVIPTNADMSKIISWLRAENTLLSADIVNTKRKVEESKTNLEELYKHIIKHCKDERAQALLVYKKMFATDMILDESFFPDGEPERIEEAYTDVNVKLTSSLLLIDAPLTTLALPAANLEEDAAEKETRLSQPQQMTTPESFSKKQ